jgi:hypothetical protein
MIEDTKGWSKPKSKDIQCVCCPSVDIGLILTISARVLDIFV